MKPLEFGRVHGTPRCVDPRELSAILRALRTANCDRQDAKGDMEWRPELPHRGHPCNAGPSKRKSDGVEVSAGPISAPQDHGGIPARPVG